MNGRDGRLFALGKAIFAVAAWGGSFVATKIALRELDPLSLVWTRFAIGVVVLGGVVLWRKQLRPIGRGEIAYFSLLGFVGITFHQWLQSNGLVTSQATTTGWIIATTPLFIALLGAIFLRERLGLGRVMGIVLAAIGVLLVVTRGDLRSLGGDLRGIGAPGDVLILLSAPNWAVFSIISRHGLQRHPAARMMFFVMVLGWLFTTALWLAGRGPHTIPHLSAGGLGAVLFLGVVCSGVAYMYWFDALERIPASQVGALLYLEPLVTVAVAASLLHEGIRFGTLAGGAIILLGVWIVTRAPIARDAAPPAGSRASRHDGPHDGPHGGPPGDPAGGPAGGPA